MGKLMVMLAVTTAFACAAPVDSAGGVTRGVEQFTLPNGIRIAVAPRPWSPVVAFHLRVGAGLADQPEGKAGVARMIEQMFLNGSESAGSKETAREKALLEEAEKHLIAWLGPDGRKGANPLLNQRSEIDFKTTLREAAGMGEALYHQRVLEENGASYRVVISADASDYGVSILAARSEILFKLFGEWLTRPSARYFYWDRDVIASQEDIASRGGPAALLSEYYGKAFAGGRYARLARPLESVGELRAGDAMAFLEKHYRGGNTALAVVGDVNPGQVRQWAAKYLETVRGSPSEGSSEVAAPLRTPESGAEPVRITTAVDGFPSLWLAWRRPADTSPEAPAWAVMDALLDGGDPSWLAQELPEIPGVAAYDYQPALPVGRHESTMVIQAAAGRGQTPAVVEKAILARLAVLAQRKVSAEELAGAKRRIRARMLNTLADPSGAAALLARVMLERGSSDGVDSYLSEVDAVTIESLSVPLARTLGRPPDYIVSVHSTGLAGIR